MPARPSSSADATATNPDIGRDTLAAIRECCQRLLASPDRAERARLARFVLPFVDHGTPSPDLLGHLVAEAMLQRFDDGLLGNANVYVQRLEQPQTTLFYLMAAAVPLVGASHRIANQYLLAALGDATTATFFELGVGRGTQLGLFLESIARSKPRLRELHVVGVDPVDDNIKATSQLVASLAPQLPFSLRFHPVLAMIEGVGAAHLPPAVTRGPLLVNSAFTFHHTHHALNDRFARTDLLRRFAALRPAIVTLAEPSSDHDTEDLVTRLENCWSHFGRVFELVDESPLTRSQKHAIKAHFFGREIRDLFAVDDRSRCERHESWDSWCTRLRDAGLVPHPPIDLDPGDLGRCEARVCDEGVALSYHGQVLAAVLPYVPSEHGRGGLS